MKIQPKKKQLAMEEQDGDTQISNHERLQQNFSTPPHLISSSQGNQEE